MVWTKYVTLFWIEFGTILDRKRNEDEYKHQPRPPTVQYPHQMMLSGKNDWYAQEWQQNQK
jgi:hypothetical protein